MVRSDWQAIRDAAVRTVTVFYCKDGRQIITNADSPTLGRSAACVNTVLHLTLSHRPRFRVTASSTLASYLWMHVKLVYPPPPHRVGFRNSFRLIRTLTFWGTNPAWLQHGPNPGMNFIVTSCKFIVVFIVVRALRG